MNKDQMIKWGVIVGGGVLAYWYVTTYGPNGHVATGAVSWWDTWFGTGTPVPSPVATTSTGVQAQATPQAVVTQPSTAPIVTAPANSQVRQQILTASASDPTIKGGYAIPDVWSYYWQQITGKSISAQQLAQMFPVTSTGTGAPLNIDQFLSGLSSLGLSGIGSIVTTSSAPSLPSMSFGGSFARPGLRGMGGRGMSRGPGMTGGSTIQ